MGMIICTRSMPTSPTYIYNSKLEDCDSIKEDDYTPHIYIIMYLCIYVST